MSFEDDNEKVRRNLVFVSAVVLLVGWLDVPIGALGEKLLSIPTATYQPGARRVWAAVCAALIYFVLRFRFSPDVITAETQLIETQRAKVARLIEAIARRHARRYTRTGKESGFFQPSLHEYVTEKARGLWSSPYPEQAGRPNFALGSFQASGTWTGRVNRSRGRGILNIRLKPPAELDCSTKLVSGADRFLKLKPGSSFSHTLRLDCFGLIH